jgi:hypothetical protein
MAIRRAVLEMISKPILYIFLYLSLSNCTWFEAGQCNRLWDGKSYLRADFSQSSELQPARVSAETISFIRQCYTRRPYIDSQHPIVLTGERTFADKSTVLVFDIIGVSDIGLGAVIDTSGKVSAIGLVPLQ